MLTVFYWIMFVIFVGLFGFQSYLLFDVINSRREYIRSYGRFIAVPESVIEQHRYQSMIRIYGRSQQTMTASLVATGCFALVTLIRALTPAS